jgi:protein-disulfide isomerase
MTTDSQPAPSSHNRVPSWKGILDVLSTVAIIVLAVTLTSVTIADRWHAQARPATPAKAKATLQPPAQPVSLAGATTKGNRASRVAIIEYSDFQCPYCGAFARTTLPTLDRDYIQPGRVLLAFRNFPLASIHPFALKAAEGVECAGRQGKFWEMHDSLFADQRHLDEESILSRADALKLGASQFARCLDGEAAASVQQDQLAGQSMDITGTPTFMIGALLQDGRVKVVNVLTGAEPFTDFQGVLNGLLDALPAGKAH